MDLIDRSLLRVTLVLALAIYAIASAGVSLVAPPNEASLIAAVQRTPLVLGVRLELNRGCLTLAVLAQLRQEHDGYTLSQGFVERSPSIDQSTPCSLLRGLKGMTRRQPVD